MRKTICFALIALLLAACGRERPSDADASQLPGSAAILSELQQCADIATTELTVRKIVIYDSSKSERFSWSKPSTWKYGDRKCIIPIEVSIKYGYDLRDMSVDDIRLAADSMAVVITLPRPKIVDAGYNLYIDEGSVVRMSTGLRSEISHELEEEIRKKGYDAVLSEDLTPAVGADVERNARSLFSAVVRNLGWTNVVVTTKQN